MDMLQYEQAALRALADPARNLFGQHGERCYHCSGLGSVLRLPNVGGPTTKATSRCTCKGSGLDIELMQRQQISALVDRMAELDKREIERAKQLDAVMKKLGVTNLRDLKNSRQYWAELIAWATADGTAVHTTTTEAILMPNITIPSNYMQDGRRLRWRVQGKLSTTSTPTMTWAIRWGGATGTLLATTEAITMGSGVANVIWTLEVDIQTRSNGATGTLIVWGRLFVHTSSTAVSPNIFGVSGYDAPAAVTVDLTADTPLSVTGDWSASSSSNTITGMDSALESLN